MAPRPTRARRTVLLGCAAIVTALAGAGIPSMLSRAGLLAAGTAAGNLRGTPARCEGAVPFAAGTGGYHTFRIPALVRTGTGTLLAFAEGRLASVADAGNIDLVLKRSTDGGCTWGPLQVVSDSGPDTSGNPAPVVTAGGRIVLLSTHNAGDTTEAAIMRGEVSADRGRRVFVQTSDDDGRTWTAPADITTQTKDPTWRWYATGPGHAIRLTHNPHRGRLVVPANHSIPPPAGSTDNGTEARYYGGHVLYSDDNGATWRIGFSDDNPDGYVNANESTVAELPDGRLYFNTREHNGTAPGNRADAYSPDGGQTLDLPYRPQATLIGPVVQASVAQLSGPDGPLVYSGPADPAARAALTLRVSTDHGATWRPALALSGLSAAYSDLAQLDDGTLGVLYETGNFGANETITFRRVPIQRLRS